MKKKLNMAATLLLISITLFIMGRNFDLNTLKSILSNVNKTYIIAALIALLVYLALETFMIHDLLRATHKKSEFFTAFKTTMIGQYYSLITPFATGGQPVQLYVMNKDKVPVGKASAVLANKFIFYQVGITIYSLVLFLFGFRNFKALIGPSLAFIITGLCINTFGLSFICMTIYNPENLKGILIKILGFLSKIKLIKNPDKKFEKYEHMIMDYRKSIDLVINDKGLIFRNSFMTLVQLTAYFSITFFIYKSLNLTGYSFIQILSLQSFLYMAVSFIPTPGTVGASEIGFHSIFAAVFSNNIMGYALFLTRGINYYINLLISALVTFIIHVTEKKKTA